MSATDQGRNVSEHRYRIGGLMRCCIETIHDRAAVAESPATGEVMACKYCSDSVIYRDGAWEWNREPDDAVAGSSADRKETGEPS